MAMDLDRYLKRQKSVIDRFLSSYIVSKKKDRHCPAILCEAMEYALMAGGKRVRPILAIAGYEAAGGTSRTIIPVAASLELIHTYSLIHDDLPAMDNDDFRRNKPTTHKVFGEGIAILAGDALLTDAFHIIAGVKADPQALLRVISELSYGAGPGGMVGGQTVDLIMEGTRAGRKDLLYIHTHKTGALIRASLRVGGIMAGCSPARLAALTAYGEKVGLAFQVVDDILDVTGSAEEMGKSPGADDARGKNTYPSTFGLKRSQRIAEKLIRESLESIRRFGTRAGPLAAIARYIISRRN
ncbi:MAG: polyprenyl synthetase family protein [Nitrospiraceae bacterium]|nr:MAG: polyprenyl synthetase family protein [Nitrospiraceae bacterium]